MSIPLQGRVAVVTGSSRGIGFHTARALAAAGASIVLNGRNADRLDAAVKQLASEGRVVHGIAGDVRLSDDCGSLVAGSLDRFGRIDILVSNAGISMRGKFEDLAPEVLRQVVEIDVIGASMPVLSAIPALKEHRGSLVFVSSLAGIRGLPGVSIYSAAKMALTGLAQALRIELGRDGVHVGIVYVGLTENDPDKKTLAADGSLIGIDRSFHATQAQVAKAIVRNVCRRKKRSVLTAAGKALVAIQWLAPGLVDFALTAGAKTVEKWSK